jgi:hypothetical protein
MLQNTYGYSPNQLVFGQNVNLPSVESDEPPATNPISRSDVVRTNLNALHKARENFIKTESSDRIRRALKYNIRTYSEVDFQAGEKVYYKRRKDKGWRGPAKVLGKETNFVLIRHGSSYYRCHPCQLMKLNDQDKDNKITETETQKAQSTNVVKPVHKKKTASFNIIDDSSSDEDNEDHINPATANNAIVNEPVIINDDIVEETITDEQPTDEQSTVPITTEEPIAAEEPIPDAESEETDDYVEMLKKADTKPEINSVIQYELLDGTTARAKVMSVQPKKHGKWKDWVNVQVIGEDRASSVCWTDVLWWRERNKSEDILVLSMNEEYTQEIVDAKEKELQNLIDNDVFEWVHDEGQTTSIMQVGFS